MKILKNKIQCNKCKQVIESLTFCSLKYCKCNTVAVSGGLESLKRSGTSSEYTELSEFIDYDQIIKTGSVK